MATIMNEMKLVLMSKEEKVRFYIDESGNQYAGLERVAKAVCDDFYHVTDQRPELLTQLDAVPLYEYGDKNAAQVMQLNESDKKITGIVAGIIGQNHFLDTCISSGICDTSAIKGKRECYSRFLVITNQGIMLGILGSDILGTIYGLFSLSELIGVSPWRYWADVHTQQRKELSFTPAELTFVSKEPSVTYRGFFMNDEWPSLGTWATQTFGGFNERFYDHVFQLLLRLKGNYFWPAMWTGAFWMDGVSDPMANANLAQEYGIYMGNSHHEPMMRASEEWDKVKSDNNDIGYGHDWNYVTNQRGLRQYWTDSIKRNKAYRNVITMGMRGERDTSMLGDFSDLSENIELLKKIISDQKEILRQNQLEDAPKLLALYKEVEDYYYGDESAPGLKDWEGLDDILLLLSDDNYGNLRTLPPVKDADRPAGWGLYYHFDYHGGPISYEWVNSSTLEKTWEEMSQAYDYGIRKLWIVNVGDLRPQELPLSYFMELAYDFEQWGTSNIESPHTFLKQWTAQQFGTYVPMDIQERITSILETYTHMNANRRPEALSPYTYPIETGEAKRELEESKIVEAMVHSLDEHIPKQLKDAFFGLVAFPALASMNVRKMNLHAAFSNFYGKHGSVLANEYADLVQSEIEQDLKLTDQYNQEMSGGKCNGMMSSAHINFQHWNSEGWKYPDTTRVELPIEPKMIVSQEATGIIVCGENAQVELPHFSNIGLSELQLTISNGGTTPFSYHVTQVPEWLTVTTLTDLVKTSSLLSLRVEKDCSVVGTKDLDGELVIEGAGETVHLGVQYHYKDLTGILKETFIENDGVLSIQASHYSLQGKSDNAQWIVLPQYAKRVSGVKVFPTTRTFDQDEKTCWVGYRFFIENPGEYELAVMMAPTNDLQKGQGQKFQLAIDEETPEIIDTLPKGFRGGSHYDRNWCEQVLRNDKRIQTKRNLSAGQHELRIYAMDAGIVLERIVFAKVGSKAHELLPLYYFGPDESFIV
ncbi:MAG: glycosyl hydrolase 115 family protein [Lachnospiraceae bacterium]|nr:glycosyl hydrolase 115 family protein [Lachnospiraceae bacterium]